MRENDNRYLWTDSMEQYIIDNCKHMKDAEIAMELTRITRINITPGAVKFKRRKLSIKKTHGINSTIKSSKQTNDNI